MRALPGSTITPDVTAAPTGLVGSIGVQIVRDAPGGTVATARTTLGIAEIPDNSGRYVATLFAPMEAGEYVIVWDDGSNPLDPDHGATQDLTVSAFLTADDADLSLVAFGAKAYMPTTFTALWTSDQYGPGFIQTQAEVVKARIYTTPPLAAEESAINIVVLDFLSRLVALSLIPAGIDYWQRQLVSETTNDSPSETATFPDPLKALSDLQNNLLSSITRDEPLVLELLSSTARRRKGRAPAIDDDGCRSTVDPRTFQGVTDHISGRRRIRGVTSDHGDWIGPWGSPR